MPTPLDRMYAGCNNANSLFFISICGIPEPPRMPPPLRAPMCAVSTPTSAAVTPGPASSAPAAMRAVVMSDSRHRQASDTETSGGPPALPPLPPPDVSSSASLSTVSLLSRSSKGSCVRKMQGMGCGADGGSWDSLGSDAQESCDSMLPLYMTLDGSRGGQCMWMSCLI